MPDTTVPTPGDTVTLDVPASAVGLTHADTGGRFTVERVEVGTGGAELHVTPTEASAPVYRLNAEHVTLQ
jgi:hypothetical protein